MFADSHNDIFMKYKSKTEILNYISKLGKCDVKKLACVYFSYNNCMDSRDIILDIINKFCIVEDINYVVSAIENAWFLTPQNIDNIIELHPEYVTLTHNECNNLGGGCNSDLGLTQWGREVVRILQNNNIIVDTAHMSEQSFWDFEKINTKPIFNSHTGVKDWVNHKRNLTMEQIKVCRESGGYIGIALYNEFWGYENLDANIIARNIIDLIDKYGSDLFGLGTDFNGIDKYPTDINNYCDLFKLKLNLNKLNLEEVSIQKFLCDNYLGFV